MSSVVMYMTCTYYNYVLREVVAGGPGAVIATTSQVFGRYLAEKYTCNNIIMIVSCNLLHARKQSAGYNCF